MNAKPALRRMPPEERREAILVAATALIATSGYNGVPLEAFATASGMTKAGLLHHFPSREHLLIAVLERRDRLDAEAVAPRGTKWPAADAASAREAADVTVELNLSQIEVMRLFAMLSAEALEPSHPAFEFFRRRLEEQRRTLSEQLFSWHPEPETAAVILLAFLDGLHLAWLRDPNFDFRESWAGFADGLFQDPVPSSSRRPIPRRLSRISTTDFRESDS